MKPRCHSDTSLELQVAAQFLLGPLLDERIAHTKPRYIFNEIYLFILQILGRLFRRVGAFCGSPTRAQVPILGSTELFIIPRHSCFFGCVTLSMLSKLIIRGS